MITSFAGTRPAATAIAVALLLAAPSTWAACGQMAESTPTAQFSDNNNGTITDNTAKLMWKQCSEGQANDVGCTGIASTHSWQQALQITEALNSGGGFAGHTDWRIPNVKELRSLVEEACHTPAINEAVFPATQSANYWTSSADANATNHAWHVSLLNGFSNTTERSNLAHVRLVRNAP